MRYANANLFSSKKYKEKTKTPKFVYKWQAHVGQAKVKKWPSDPSQ